MHRLASCTGRLGLACTSPSVRSACSTPHLSLSLSLHRSPRYILPPPLPRSSTLRRRRALSFAVSIRPLVSSRLSALSLHGSAAGGRQGEEAREAGAGRGGLPLQRGGGGGRRRGGVAEAAGRVPVPVAEVPRRARRGRRRLGAAGRLLPLPRRRRRRGHRRAGRPPRLAATAQQAARALRRRRRLARRRRRRRGGPRLAIGDQGRRAALRVGGVTMHAVDRLGPRRRWPHVAFSARHRLAHRPREAGLGWHGPVDDHDQFASVYMIAAKNFFTLPSF